jgi:hypothetical protein
MQYQTRLLRAQPGITAGRLVYYVGTEAKIQELFETLAKLSELLSESTSKLLSKQNEIEFRVRRICTFLAEQPVLADRCSNFLKLIPFDAKVGTGKPDSSEAARHVTDIASDPISADVIQTTKRSFVSLMGNPKVGDIPLSELIDLYSLDLAIIAGLNKTFLLETQPFHTSAFKQYASTCNYLASLINSVTYREIDIGGCRQYAELSGPPVTRHAPVVPTPDAGQPPSTTANGVSGQGLQEKRIENVPADRETGNSQKAQRPEHGSSSAGGETPAVSPGTQSPAPDARIQNSQNAERPEGANPPGGAGSPAVSPGTPLPGMSTAPTPALLPLVQRTSATLVEQQRDFELVSHYRFYDQISFGLLKDILISPSEFLALMLVCFSGILGALLRVIFGAYESGQNPELRAILISPILGLIAALVVYVLFRAGFIALTDRPQNESSTLSPFVVAFVSMTAGLLSERAIELFRKTSGTWLGSGEGSQKARWAVGLSEALRTAQRPASYVADQIKVSEELFLRWVNEAEPVPVDKQREIALVLEKPVRRIFTDIEPSLA